MIVGMMPDDRANAKVSSAFGTMPLPSNLGQLLFLALCRENLNNFARLFPRLINGMAEPDRADLKKPSFVNAVWMVLKISGLASELPKLNYSENVPRPTDLSECFGWFFEALAEGAEPLLHVEAPSENRDEWVLVREDRFRREEAVIDAELAQNKFAFLRFLTRAASERLIQKIDPPISFIDDPFTYPKKQKPNK